MKRIKEVNWDKAPEGATHYNAACGFPWLRGVPASFYLNGLWMEYSSDNDYWKVHFKNAIKRPQEWDGSGVPPVGTVCEYRLGEDSTWFKCKIMYVLSGSDHCFVAWCDHLASDQFFTFLSDSYELQLRKIKTPEQIAAEERLHAIDEMIELVAGDSSFNEVMSILYDAGYHKS